MKIYAKQVTPEYQEPPLFMDEWPENVYIFGNRHFRDHGAEYIENIKNSMYDAAYELKQLIHGLHARNYSLIEILNDFLHAENRRRIRRRANLRMLSG